MGIIQHIRKMFGFSGGDLSEAAVRELFVEISYKKLAIDACVNMLAATLSGCEFLTFEQGTATRKDLYYLLNVRPNPNQSAGEFWNSFVSRLLKDNEVLVVQHSDGNLYVADSFNVDDNVIYPHRYENVTVGSLVFARWFDESDVLHVKLHDENISRLIDGIYADYGKLIASAEGIFKRKNALRVVVETPAWESLTEDARNSRKKLFENDFRSWFEADNAGAALPLPKDLKLHDWSEKSRSQTVSRDIRALIDDIFDFTATAFRIPARLLRGDVAELSQATDSLIMFAVKPLAELIQDEINAKMFTKAEYLSSSHVKIDTHRIKLVDITRFAAAADRLFAASVHSINDNRRMLDLEPIPEPWANKYYVTKNYQQTNLQAQKGGDKDGNE
jgi:HK97 family phage portal protein